MDASTRHGRDADATRPPGPGRVDLAWGLAILLLGLGLRLAYAAQYSGHPQGRLLWVDEQAYWERASTIRAGRWLPDGPFYQDPLIGYLLAGLMAAVGDGVPALRLALAAIGSLTPAAIFLAGRVGLGRAEGVAAGLMAAAYGPLIFTDGLIEKEGPAALLAAVGLALAAWAYARPASVLPSAACGAAWAGVALLRGNALLVGPIGVAWSLLAPRALPAWRRALRAAGFGLAFAAVLAPASLVNYAVSRPHQLMLTTWQTGANFYLGNHPGAGGLNAAPAFVEPTPQAEGPSWAAEAERRTGRRLTPNEVSDYWLRRGLAWWSSRPGDALRLLGRKLVLAANDFEVADSTGFELARLLAWPSLALGFLSFGWVLPPAAIGLCRPRAGLWAFAAATTLAGLGSTVAFFVLGRYRIPWTPGLLLLSAAGLVDLARLAASGRAATAALLVAAVGLPAACLAWLPRADPSPQRWGHYQVGLFVAHLGAGDLDRAIDALDDARAMGREPSGWVSSYLASGPARDRLAAAVVRATSALRPGRDRPGDMLAVARYCRVLPETRALSRSLLDELLRLPAADPAATSAAWGESGAWWLGEPAGPAPRAEAARALARAAPGSRPSITLAILRGDPGPLAAVPAAGGVDPARLRLARAFLRAHPSGGR